MPLDCDLAAVVYDPPAPGFPHMAVLFDGLWRGHRGAPRRIHWRVRAALVSLVSELTNEQRATA